MLRLSEKVDEVTDAALLGVAIGTGLCFVVLFVLVAIGSLP